MCAGSLTDCGAYASADAVFVGFVKRVDGPKPNHGNAPVGSAAGQIAHVQVEKVFKGINEAEVTFYSGGSSCDYVYKEGERWLFYAHYDNKSETWGVGVCGRSRSIENAADDLLFLQALPNAMRRTRISGVVEHYEDNAQPFSRVENIAGAKVKLVSGQKTYEVLTDANGVYEIYDLPPGQYAIEPEVPPGLKVRFPIYHGDVDYTDRPRARVILREGSCAGADFILSADTKISGRVIGADGHALPNVCLSLQPKDRPVRDNWIFDCTKKQGQYELKNIPPGEYMIVINYDGKISSDEPFPRVYYPGVFEKERAIVLSIPSANKMDNYDITIPSQEARNLIQGVVQYSDGTPAEDASSSSRPMRSRKATTARSTRRSMRMGDSRSMCCRDLRDASMASCTPIRENT